MYIRYIKFFLSRVFFYLVNNLFLVPANCTYANKLWYIYYIVITFHSMLKSIKFQYISETFWYILCYSITFQIYMTEFLRWDRVISEPFIANGNGGPNDCLNLLQLFLPPRDGQALIHFIYDHRTMSHYRRRM